MDDRTKNKVKKHALAADIHTLTLKEIDVPVTTKKVSDAAYSTWVRALMQNWRQGTVGVKERSDVARSTKKPWKQKGTGRARAGTARSPLWRGGGVTFGPQPRVRKLTIPQQIKKSVLNTILKTFIDNNKVALIDWQIEGDAPKTAQAFTLLKESGLKDRKVALFLPKSDQLSYASFSNIPNVNIIYFDQPNAFNLTNVEYWVVLKKDLDQFKEMVARWN